MLSNHHDTEPIIRSLWAMDREAIHAHFLRLDADTRQARFAGNLSNEAVIDYARTILRIDSAVFGAFVHGKLRAIAELRGLYSGWPISAEAAFSVEQDWQNRGIGEALFEHILKVAQNRGVKTLYMICLRENEPMQHLAKKASARLRYEPGAVEATLNPHWPTPMSLIHELCSETRGFAFASWHWPKTRS